MVDLIGTMFEDDVIATAFGTHVCLPLLRKAGSDLSKEEATKVMEDCLRVLFYRNTKSSTRVRSDPSFPGVRSRLPCATRHPECLCCFRLHSVMRLLLGVLWGAAAEGVMRLIAQRWGVRRSKFPR
jgi:hypothetical protein